MQKVRCHKKVLQQICFHYILGSFNTKKVLFHLSFTVLISLSIYSSLIGTRVDPLKNKFIITRFLNKRFKSYFDRTNTFFVLKVF